MPVAQMEPQQERVTFSTDEVCRLTGATFRMLDYWVRTGIITPTVNSHGSGSFRRFSAANVADVQLVVALRELGVELERAAELLGVVRRYPNGVIVASGTEAEVVNAALIAAAVAARGGAAVVLVPTSPEDTGGG